MSLNNESEIFITCPYDPIHQIIPQRLSTHLIKCAKQHPNIKLKQCPYDSTHLLKAQDYLEHVENCQHSNEDSFQEYFTKYRQSYCYEPSPAVEISTEEDWDIDIENDQKKSSTTISQSITTSVNSMSITAFEDSDSDVESVIENPLASIANIDEVENSVKKDEDSEVHEKKDEEYIVEDDNETNESTQVKSNPYQDVMNANIAEKKNEEDNVQQLINNFDKINLNKTGFFKNF